MGPRRKVESRCSPRPCRSPPGFAFLGQEMYADDYRGAVVTFRGEFRTEDIAGSAGLFLRIHTDPRDLRGPLTEHAASADPGNNLVAITGHRDWTSHEVTARVPDDANIVMFGIFLAGPRPDRAAPRGTDPRRLSSPAASAPAIAGSGPRPWPDRPP